MRSVGVAQFARNFFLICVWHTRTESWAVFHW